MITFIGRFLYHEPLYLSQFHAFLMFLLQVYEPEKTQRCLAKCHLFMKKNLFMNFFWICQYAVMLNLCARKTMNHFVTHFYLILTCLPEPREFFNSFTNDQSMWIFSRWQSKSWDTCKVPRTWTHPCLSEKHYLTHFLWFIFQAFGSFHEKSINRLHLTLFDFHEICYPWSLCQKTRKSHSLD